MRKTGNHSEFLSPCGPCPCQGPRRFAEHDENEMRKAFTVSERVAIAEAVAERLGNRQGGDRKTDQGGNISTLIDHGKTRDLAAAKAGLGSGKTLEAAQAVIANGTPELVQVLCPRRWC